MSYTLGLWGSHESLWKVLFYFLHQLVGPLQIGKTTLKMCFYPLKMNLLSLFSLVGFNMEILAILSQVEKREWVLRRVLEGIRGLNQTGAERRSNNCPVPEKTCPFRLSILIWGYSFPCSKELSGASLPGCIFTTWRVYLSKARRKEMFSTLEGKAGERSAEQPSEGSQSGMTMGRRDYHIWMIRIAFIAKYCQCSI